MTGVKSDISEVRWHGRGGQGAVTAAKIVAAAALHQGKHFQGFPEYGPERRGAPVRAFNRIAASPMHNLGPVTEPDVVVVLDPSLIESGAAGDGLGAGATLIVNTRVTPEQVAGQLGRSDVRVVTIDATSIAVETIGRPIVNTVMIGAMAAATGLLDLEALEAEVRHTFEGSLPPKAVEANVTAVRRAYELVSGGSHGEA